MQTNTFKEPAPAPWYRHRWPWLIMLGPFLVVLAGSYTMWLAYSRQDALVVGEGVGEAAFVFLDEDVQCWEEGRSGRADLVAQLVVSRGSCDRQVEVRIRGPEVVGTFQE